MFARPGRDDGFGPFYGLLGKLRDLCANNPVVGKPTAALPS